MKSNPADYEMLARLASYLAKSGAKEQARTVLGQIPDSARLSSDGLYALAMTAEFSGDRVAAITRLAQAASSGYSTAELNRDPDLESIRRDAQYQRVVLPAAPSRNK